jgi:hypothetical protein
MIKTSWLEALVIERLETKASRIDSLLEQNKNNWEETFYQTLARNFGFGLNSDPFEWLAKSLPIKLHSKTQKPTFTNRSLAFWTIGFITVKPSHR